MLAATLTLTPATLLTCALVLASLAGVGLLAVHRETLRRVLLRAGDPRPLGLFRLAFGLCLVLNLLEAAPHAAYLFSDEGLIPHAAVAQVYGKQAMLGVGDGVREPAGLADGRAALHYLLSGRWSLLHFQDSPALVRGYLAVLLLAAVGLTIGWRSRGCAALCWLLFAGLLRRGDAHWGGEQVYCGLLFPLMLSRCGEAFSVDNWLRCRRLRARGLLSRPGGPGDGAGAAPCAEHPQGLAAIYRRVPVWPQALIAAQLTICYVANGWVKSGPLWSSGDALLFSLHLDSYARLDWHPLALGLGPLPLRLATWTVLWWERLFPLVPLALWLRHAARWDAPALEARQRRLARACWLVLALALALAAWPDNLVEKPGLPGGLTRALCLALAAAGIVLGLLRAGRSPTPRQGPRTWTLDRALLARLAALWLGVGLAFHLVNFTLLNVGAFGLATLSAYLLCGAGPAAVRGLQRLTRALARRGVPVPEHMARETAIAAEDPSLPQLQRDGATLPGGALLAAGGLILLAAALALAHGPREGLAWWHAGWLSAGTGLVWIGWRRARRDADAGPPLREPWAHGPAGRLAAGGLLAYHLVALLVWQLPRWPALPFRDSARALVDPWMELSFTRQWWSMFAPNAPRDNRSLRTTIIDADGTRHDLRTELQHHLQRPYLRQDRGRKIMEGVTGGRPELAPWHARYLCRRWALDHAGQLPHRVILERVKAPILPYDPRDALEVFRAEARVEPIQDIACADAPFAQLGPELRARHGLPPAAPGSLHYTWPKGQPATWAERRAGLDPLAPLWPLLALLLSGALAVWAREDRRRHVARIVARRQKP